MAIMTRIGRASLAESILLRPLHIGIGTGDPAWNTFETVGVAFGADDAATLLRHPVYALTVKSLDGQTVYTVEQDYAVDLLSGVITRVPGGLIGAQATVLAGYNVVRPPESPQATALLNEVGRRVADETQFVTPDLEGPIRTRLGNFRASATRTNQIRVSATLDFTEAANVVIREMALFVGTSVIAGLPPGQRYFTPAEIADPGTLLCLEHRAPLVREDTSHDGLFFIATF